MTKRCTKCGEEKALDSFPPRKNRKDGRCSHCHACNRKKTGQWRQIPENAEKDRESSRRFHEENREQSNATRRERYREEMADPARHELRLLRGQQWREENREHGRLYAAEWRRNNPDKNTAKAAKRRAVQMQASPAWTTPADFAPVYALAADCTALSGEQHHVDHIVPLHGETVCGLHVPWNLRVITATENLSKGAKFIEEMGLG